MIYLIYDTDIFTMEAKKSIGEKIKQIRVSKKIDIHELSVRCNLEKEYIAQIEENKIMPTLSSLIKIARSLGIYLSTFIDNTSYKGPVLTLAGEKEKEACFKNKNQKKISHMDFFTLACNKQNRHMEPFIIDIHPGDANNHKLSSHEGEEFIFVLDGKIEINYGKELYILNTGDSIYYDSIVSHNLHAYENNTARILAVIYTPT